MSYSIFQSPLAYSPTSLLPLDQTTVQDFRILQEPHPPPDDTQALYKHWPSLVGLSTKALKQQRIAREISLEVGRLSSLWKPHGVPSDLHFWQGQIVRGPDIGVGENDFRHIGVYHYLGTSTFCLHKYHPWTRSLSEEQILDNDILTPLLLMREELRPKHRLAHRQREELKRITIRHSRLYIAAAQKYYDEGFKDSSWFRAAVQRYNTQQVSTIRTPTGAEFIEAKKRKPDAYVDGFSSSPPKRKRIASSTTATKSSVSCKPRHFLNVATGSLSLSDPPSPKKIMSDEKIPFTTIATRTEVNRLTRPRPAIGGTSVRLPKEVIELTDTESDGETDGIDWEDQVPFTIVIWTSSTRHYEDLLLHSHAGNKVKLVCYKIPLGIRGIDVEHTGLEAYDPLSATWVSVDPHDMIGPFTVSNNKPRVFLLRYKGVNLLQGFDMLRKVASQIPIPSGGR